MTSGKPVRFPISFDGPYRLLSSVLFLPPSSAYVEIDGNQVQVRMGWAFRSAFARGAVASATESHSRPFSRGVHGFGGRWLVNGSGRGILSIELMPPQRAYVVGYPVRLQQLMVSVAEPATLARALTASAPGDARTPPGRR